MCFCKGTCLLQYRHWWSTTNSLHHANHKTHSDRNYLLVCLSRCCDSDCWGMELDGRGYHWALLSCTSRQDVVVTHHSNFHSHLRPAVVLPKCDNNLAFRKEDENGFFIMDKTATSAELTPSTICQKRCWSKSIGHGYISSENYVGMLNDVWNLFQT